MTTTHLTKWIRSVLAAAMAIAVGLAITPTQVVNAAPVVAVDDAGPDDEPGQKDLNSLSVDYGAPGATNIAVTFNFDNTSTTGANTLDGCALFDTDADGFANYSQCHTIASDGTQTMSQYVCTADSRSDRCGGPTAVATFASSSSASIVVGSDPFQGVASHNANNKCKTFAACVTDDYVVTADIAVVADFGASAILINVCSYPSREPNSDPSDCVFSPENGFLTIVKTTDQTTSQQFLFDVSEPSADGSTQFSTTGAGTVSTISYAPTSTLDIAEVIPADWALASASCAIQTATPTPTGSAAADGVTDLEIRSGLATICTFDNDKRITSLTLVKTVVNDNGGSAVASDWTLTADGGPTPISGVGGATSGNDFAAGTYDLAESAGPGGYQLASLTCDNSGAAQVTTVTVQIGEQVTCTFVNDDEAPSLTLTKEVVNDNGGTAAPGDFTLTAAGYSAGEPQAGTYALSESGPSGYTQTSLTCSNSAGQVSSVTLGLGEDVTCTFVNDDVGPGLTLIKEVVNDNGGTAVPTDFTLTAAGYDPLDPQAGTYALSESGPAGYTQTSLTCDNSGAAQVTSVTLAIGESVVCTFVNDDDAPALSLIKIVTNDNGGTAAPTDFTLTAAGYDAGSPDAGTYQLSESGPSGYTQTSLTCSNSAGQVDSVTLGLGESVVCTFVNDDDAPSLTLVKQVVNDNGGTAVPGDFTLVAAGYDPLDPQTGTYQLSESGPAGYTQISLTCDNGAGQVSSVTLGLGEDVTCTFVNDDVGPGLTLIKQVVNDNGGTAAPGDFTLTAAGYDPLDPQAGTYALSESGPAGYTQTSLTCDNSVGQVASVTIGLGESVVCTFVNDDDAPSLTLVKQVVNDNGGTATAGDWTLTAAGYDSASPDAGVYTLSESGGPAGYTQTSLTCDNSGAAQVTSVSLALGEDVTCTFVNDDDAPSLTLIKQVVNDDGGEAIAADFVLTASGPTGISGVSGVTSGDSFVAGVYRLSETGPEGYAAGAWACEGGDQEGSSLTLTVGESATCTIVNDDRPVDLELTKDDDGIEAVAGGAPFDYTISVRNIGTRDVDLGEPVTVTDVLPVGLVWVSFPANCSQAGRTLTCDVDPAALPAGGTAVIITATVRAEADAPSGTYVNKASVTTEDDTTTNPPCPAIGDNNVDCEETPVDRQGDIRIVKTDDVATGDSVEPGDSFTYRLVVTNTGVSTILPGTHVEDDLPAQLELVSVIGGAGWTCNDTSPVDCDYAPELDPGESAPPITVTVTVADDATGDSIENVAVVLGAVDRDCPTATDRVVESFAPACNQVTDDDDETTPLVANADLAIVKTASVAQVGAGGGFDWILDITNNGPGTAIGVVIGDLVPSSLTVTGVASDDFTCGNRGNAVTCTVASLAAGASGTVTITVTVPLVAPDGDVTNVGTVESSTPDPDLTNNSDDETVTIVAQAPPTTTLPPVTLPRTGSNATQDMLRFALLCVLVGGAVMSIARRRREDGVVVG